MDQQTLTVNPLPVGLSLSACLFIGCCFGWWVHGVGRRREVLLWPGVGFAACTVAGVLGGVLCCLVIGWDRFVAAIGSFVLAAPTAGVFYLIISVSAASKQSQGLRRGYSGLSEEDYQRMVVPNADAGESVGRYTLIGPMVVCNDCQHATSKQADGEVPPECPDCGLRFRRAGKTKPKKAMPVAQAVEVVDLTAERPG